MTTFSPLKAVASCLPVIGPVVGFFNRFEKTIVVTVDLVAEQFFFQEPDFAVSEARHIEHQYKIFYAHTAAVGSILTLISAIALAALGFSTAPKLLFALGAIALIDTLLIAKHYQVLCQVEQKIGMKYFAEKKPLAIEMLDSADWKTHREIHREHFQRLSDCNNKFLFYD